MIPPITAALLPLHQSPGKRVGPASGRRKMPRSAPGAWLDAPRAVTVATPLPPQAWYLVSELCGAAGRWRWARARPRFLVQRRGRETSHM